MKTYSQFRLGNYTSASEFRFCIGGKNPADRLILSAKMKIFEKSASKNKHPIKLRFSDWRLQNDNSEKKVIPEKHAFGSYPFPFSLFETLNDLFNFSVVPGGTVDLFTTIISSFSEIS